MSIKIDDLTYHSLQEVSQILGLSVQTLRQYVKTGRLEARFVGIRYFVSKDAIKTFLQNSQRRRAGTNSARQELEEPADGPPY